MPFGSLFAGRCGKKQKLHADNIVKVEGKENESGFRACCDTVRNKGAAASKQRGRKKLTALFRPRLCVPPALTYVGVDLGEPGAEVQHRGDGADGEANDLSLADGLWTRSALSKASQPPTLGLPQPPPCPTSGPGPSRPKESRDLPLKAAGLRAGPASRLSTVRVVAVPSREKRQAALMEAVAVGRQVGDA